MKITCEQCRASLNLPDEKIPQVKSFRVQCPRCRHAIVVRTAAPEEADSAPPPLDEVLTAERSADDDETFLDVLEGGVRAALVCLADAGHQATVVRELKEMGFQPYVEDDPDRAVRRLRQGAYEVLVMGEPLDDKDRRHVLVDFLKALPMTQRRTLFTCLVSPRERTMDSLAAFRKEVDLVIHTDDLVKMQPVLHRELKSARSFYRLFKEALEERGQL
ncbi:MAG: zinc-ribbon domain-containing protein [Desulfosoma sp.]